jgi:hypothetical protein
VIAVICSVCGCWVRPVYYQPGMKRCEPGWHFPYVNPETGFADSMLVESTLLLCVGSKKPGRVIDVIDEQGDGS